MENLAVLIPFYNEENFLRHSINRLIDSDIADQIILIDDCSSDGSLNIAKEIASDFQFVTLLQSKKNLGKGHALNLAKGFIKTSHVIVHDADLEYFPDDIIELVKNAKLSPNSLILGSRFKGNLKRENLYKRTYIANKLMSLLFSIVHFYKISDIATCYKLLPVTFLKSIDLKENGFAIEVELIAKFMKFNKSVIEVPIRYSGRSYEDGKKIKTSDGFIYILKTFKYRFFN